MVKGRVRQVLFIDSKRALGDALPVMHLPSILLCASALLLTVIPSPAAAPDLGTIPLKDIQGKDTSLKAYSGKVLLLVNVASQCGYTRQYEGLEALHKKYQDKGLVVLGFPSNDFGGQEPGSEEEIAKFCKTKFDVNFPLFSKIHTKGDQQHPLYAALTGPDSPKPGPIKWNFNKFLIGRDGKIVNRYDSKVEPQSEELTKEIEAALAAK
jgi:glutathione peroxidase